MSLLEYVGVKKNAAMGNELRKPIISRSRERISFSYLLLRLSQYKLIESRNLVLLAVICLAFSNA